MAAYSELGLIGTISENDDVKLAQESSDSDEDDVCTVLISFSSAIE